PPRPTLLPYTPLFRSSGQAAFALVEETIHHRLVDLDDLVDDLLVPVGDRAEVALASRSAEAVDNAPAAVAGQIERQYFRSEGRAQVVEDATRVRALGVDAVDHDGAAEAALPGTFHHPPGAVFHAVD